MNGFYASVECLHRPAIRNYPVVVGGDEEARHGIVLAKNTLAKPFGIKTGEALWQARNKCPSLVVVPPNYPLYLRYARLARQIYGDYTGQIEPFGLDEAWLDVSGSDGELVANEIRSRIKRELGVTASVGVSFNKVFAKLGSDYKKPDATTVITEDNFKEIAWPLPVEDLLYVGHATKTKLERLGITTIGQLAQAPLSMLRSIFGKVGGVLYSFANGLDYSPVAALGEEAMIKSIGNGITTPRDLTCNEDVKIMLFILCESVAARLAEHGFVARTVVIYIRDNDLYGLERQAKQPRPTCISGEIAAAAFHLFQQHYRWYKPVRSLGVRCTDLIPASAPQQLSIFGDEEQRQKKEALDRTVENLRYRFGHSIIQRASVLMDAPFSVINPKGDHIIHPVGLFKESMG
jgi:DNA polymerase-4